MSMSGPRGRKALLTDCLPSIALAAPATQGVGPDGPAAASIASMLKCYELVGFMPAALAQEILEYAYSNDKPLYRGVLAAVAEANRVRPVFLERKPRAQRHVEMISTLGRPRREEAAATLLRGWLLKAENAMLVEFLDALGIKHEKGVVEDFPPTVEDDKLKAAVEGLLAKHPKERVTLYLNTVQATGGVTWNNLEELLQNDARLQIA